MSTKQTKPSPSRRFQPLAQEFSPSICPSAQVPNSEELLVIDARAELTPAQMVEQKLKSLLEGKELPVSHMRMIGLTRFRA